MVLEGRKSGKVVKRPALQVSGRSKLRRRAALYVARHNYLLCTVWNAGLVQNLAGAKSANKAGKAIKHCQMVFQFAYIHKRVDYSTRSPSIPATQVHSPS